MKKVMLLAPENLCDILRDALEKKYITLPCYDPENAKELLLSEPDALILSLFLPGMDGLTFLRENTAILPPRVIALTVYFDDAILLELEDLGVSQVIRIFDNFAKLQIKNQLIRHKTRTNPHNENFLIVGILLSYKGSNFPFLL